MELIDKAMKPDKELAMFVYVAPFLRQAKAIAWARLKLLAKWNPKKYGEKVGVEAKGDISLTISTGVPQV